MPVLVDSSIPETEAPPIADTVPPIGATEPDEAAASVSNIMPSHDDSITTT